MDILKYRRYLIYGLIPPCNIESRREKWHQQRQQEEALRNAGISCSKRLGLESPGVHLPFENMMEPICLRVPCRNME